MEALDFFEGLEADNSKTYWTANKAIYDEKVYAPMAALVADLEPEFGTGKIFRPYRDVRFSADKTPYKTNIAAVLGEGYVQLTAAGLGAGLGMYQMASDQLARYRAAVADDSSGAELERVIAAIVRAQDNRHRARRAEDRAAWVRPRPPAGRSVAVQGSHRLAGVAGGAVARASRRPRIGWSSSCAPRLR